MRHPFAGRRANLSSIGFHGYEGFAHQFSNRQGTHLCFAPQVTVKVLDTKICARGSNIDTRKHHGNSTNCYMSQEKEFRIVNQPKAHLNSNHSLNSAVEQQVVFHRLSQRYE